MRRGPSRTSAARPPPLLSVLALVANAVGLAAAGASAFTPNSTRALGNGRHRLDLAEQPSKPLPDTLGHGLERHGNGSSSAYGVSGDERRGMGRLFSAVDLNGDGRVDVEELRTFLDVLAVGDADLSDALRREGNGRARPRDSRRDGAVPIVDAGDTSVRLPSTPGSNPVTSAGVSGPREVQTNEEEDDERALTPLQLLFRREDGDGDGALSRSEFEAALVAWSMEVGGEGDGGNVGDVDDGAADDGRRERVFPGARRSVKHRRASGEGHGQEHPGGRGAPPSRRYSKYPPTNRPSNMPSMGPRAPPWKDYVETHGLAVPEKDAAAGRRRRRRWGNYGEFDDEW